MRARSRASPADTTTSPLREDACIASFLSRTRSLQTPIDKDTTMNEKNTRDIQLSVELDASPEEVFRAVTVGTEIAKWLAPEARVTAPEGGKKGSIWISWGEGMSAEHEIEIFDAPKRMRHPSGQNGETKAPLYADWSIEAREGGKTTLRLVHSGFSASADWDDEYEAHARGWRVMLQNL
ncbi:MAG TPA: SRPBCC domain-containing protein, partial [Myxococcales bacterium]|nr:SRPBCC domain-containing protein [Myxococcales bacterium]